MRGYLIAGKQKAAKAQIATFVQAVETYYAHHDQYPSNDQGLEVLTGKTDRIPDALMSKIPKDPWGRPYQYNQPGSDSPYEIISYGADGREGGEPSSPDSDIKSTNLDEGN